MATRNTAGRRLLSEAELEFANPFDEAVYSNILETFNAPPVVAPQVVQPTTTDAVPSIDEILIQGGGNPVVINDVLYQPVFASTGQGETFEQGPLTQVVAYNPSETDPGQAYKTYTPDMQEAGAGKFQEVGNVGDLLQTAAEDLGPLIAMALTAGGAGGALGGFLSGGALTGTAASALGNALISGASGALAGQDPLKSALLAAGGTYAGSLFGGPSAASGSTVSDAQFIAADAAQLASQGIQAPQIEQILQASGVSPVVAIGAADAAVAGLSIPEIAKEITLGNRGLFTEAVNQAPVTPAEVVTSPEGLQTITVPAAAPVANISDIVAAIPSAVLPQTDTPTVNLPPLKPVGLMAPEAPQAVEVIGTAAAPEAPTLQDIIVALTSSPPPEAPVPPVEAPVAPVPEQVTVTAPKAPELTLSDALAALGGAVTAPMAPVEAPVAPVPEQVTVTAPKASELTLSDALAALGGAVTAPVPFTEAFVPPVEAPVAPVPEQVTVTAPKASEVTLSDALAALTGTVEAPVPSAEAPQTVEVTGTTPKASEPTLSDALAALTGTVSAPMPSAEAPQIVEVTGTAPKASEPTLSDALAALTGTVSAPMFSAEAPQIVEVTGAKNKGITSEDTGATIGTIPGVLEPGVGPQSGGGLETADQAARTEKQDTGLTLKDLYTALQALGALSSSGLFGGGGGGTQRPFVAPTATVPIGNADYYNAVQQYYNTYMPQTPRNVATPLQQWYEGKFGG